MATGKHITCYLDCVSPWSRFAFLHLRRQTATLALHGVTIEYVPIFLGGVNHGTGNKPPWTLPAKAKHSSFDLARGMKYFDTPKMKSPDCFPIVSLLVGHVSNLSLWSGKKSSRAVRVHVADNKKPQRAMCYVKQAYSSTMFFTLFAELWVGLWEENTDISKPELLATVLSRHLATEEVETVIAAAQTTQWKEALNRNTQESLSRGAYGSPWFWVSNGKGVSEPFFGSDRFHFMWDFLDIPHSDFTVLEDGRARL